MPTDGRTVRAHEYHCGAHHVSAHSVHLHRRFQRDATTAPHSYFYPTMFLHLRIEANTLADEHNWW